MDLPVDPKEAVTYGALGIFALEKIISVFFSEYKTLRTEVAKLRAEQSKNSTSMAVLKEQTKRYGKDLDILWVRWRREHGVPREDDQNVDGR